MERDKVKSSQINSIGYDAAAELLEIEFKNRKDPEAEGAVYQYWPFTAAKWADFRQAESIGSYFAHHIRPDTSLTVKKIVRPENDQEKSTEAPGATQAES